MPSLSSSFGRSLSALPVVLLALVSALHAAASPPPTAPPVDGRADATVYYQMDEMSGSTFFDHWSFFDEPDPTHGQVNYIGIDAAWQKGLVYIGQDDGLPVMRADGWTTLAYGAKRDSIRLESKRIYNGGLFIFDLAAMPFGCSLWPAVWSYGPSWPNNGEIDIVEGINLQTINQMVIHTAEGCYLTNPGAFTGTALSTNCGPSSGGSGCQIEDRANPNAWGQAFNSNGGGTFALLWDGSGVKIWSWTTATVPADISARTPNPTTWGTPAGAWAPASCDPYNYFREHSLVMNIAICGDWAGGAYASSGCGTDCAAQVMDPNNFKTASFVIRSVRTYTADGLSAGVNGLLGSSHNGTAASTSSARRAGLASCAPLVLVSGAALVVGLLLV